MPHSLAYQTPTAALPTGVKVVAWLFISLGLYSVFNITTALSEGRVNLDFGIFALLIGPGLLRRSAMARIWALVYTWIALIGIPAMLLLAWTHRDHLTAHFGAHVLRPAPFALILIPLTLLWMLAFWQYRVLTRPEVRALFTPPVPPSQSNQEISQDLRNLAERDRESQSQI